MASANMNKNFGSLILFTKDLQEGPNTFPISKEVLIGRDKSSDIAIRVKTVSRIHVKISIDENGRCHLQNLSKTNPCVLNQQQLENEDAVILADGDIFTLGDRSFKYALPLKEKENEKEDVTLNHTASYKHKPTLDPIGEEHSGSFSPLMHSKTNNAQKGKEKGTELTPKSAKSSSGILSDRSSPALASIAIATVVDDAKPKAASLNVNDELLTSSDSSENNAGDSVRAAAIMKSSLKTPLRQAIQARRVSSDGKAPTLTAAAPAAHMDTAHSPAAAKEAQTVGEEEGEGDARVGKKKLRLQTPVRAKAWGEPCESSPAPPLPLALTPVPGEQAVDLNGFEHPMSVSPLSVAASAEKEDRLAQKGSSALPKKQGKTGKVSIKSPSPSSASPGEQAERRSQKKVFAKGTPFRLGGSRGSGRGSASSIVSGSATALAGMRADSDRDSPSSCSSASPPADSAAAAETSPVFGRSSLATPIRRAIETRVNGTSKQSLQYFNTYTREEVLAMYSPSPAAPAVAAAASSARKSLPLLAEQRDPAELLRDDLRRRSTSAHIAMNETILAAINSRRKSYGAAVAAMTLRLTPRAIRSPGRRQQGQQQSQNALRSPRMSLGLGAGVATASKAPKRLATPLRRALEKRRQSEPSADGVRSPMPLASEKTPQTRGSESQEYELEHELEQQKNRSATPVRSGRTPVSLPAASSNSNLKAHSQSRKAMSVSRAVILLSASPGSETAAPKSAGLKKNNRRLSGISPSNFDLRRVEDSKRDEDDDIEEVEMLVTHAAAHTHAQADYKSSVIEATCAQISMDAMTAELVMQGCPELSAVAQAKDAFIINPKRHSLGHRRLSNGGDIDDSDAFSIFDEIISPVRSANRSPLKLKRAQYKANDGEGLVTSNAALAADATLTNESQPAKGTTKRSRTSLLNSLEKQGGNKVRSSERLDAVSDLVSALTDDEMQTISNYASQLELFAADSTEAYALALDAYIRGVEQGNLESPFSPLAGSPVAVAVAASADANVERLLLPPKPPAVDCEAAFESLRSLFHLPKGRASAADIMAVECYTQLILEDADVDTAVAYSAALDTFLASPSEFRARVQHLMLQKKKMLESPFPSAEDVCSAGRARVVVEREDEEALWIPSDYNSNMAPTLNAADCDNDMPSSPVVVVAAAAGCTPCSASASASASTPSMSARTSSIKSKSPSIKWESSAASVSSGRKSFSSNKASTAVAAAANASIATDTKLSSTTPVALAVAAAPNTSVRQRIAMSFVTDAIRNVINDISENTSAPPQISAKTPMSYLKKTFSSELKMATSAINNVIDSLEREEEEEKQETTPTTTVASSMSSSTPATKSKTDETRLLSTAKRTPAARNSADQATPATVAAIVPASAAKKLQVASVFVKTALQQVMHDLARSSANPLSELSSHIGKSPSAGGAGARSKIQETMPMQSARASAKKRQHIAMSFVSDAVQCVMADLTDAYRQEKESHKLAEKENAKEKERLTASSSKKRSSVSSPSKITLFSADSPLPAAKRSVNISTPSGMSTATSLASAPFATLSSSAAPKSGMRSPLTAAKSVGKRARVVIQAEADSFDARLANAASPKVYRETSSAQSLCPTPISTPAKIQDGRMVATPKVATPKTVTTLKTATPKVATPKVATPLAATPRVATPKAATPLAATPKVATSKVATPKVATPKVATPKVATPLAATPKVATPKVVTQESDKLAATPPATPPATLSAANKRRASSSATKHAAANSDGVTESNARVANAPKRARGSKAEPAAAVEPVPAAAAAAAAAASPAKVTATRAKRTSVVAVVAEPVKRGRKSSHKVPQPAAVEVVEEEEEAMAIICDSCDQEHFCDEVGLTAIPDGDWFCASCVAQKSKKTKKAGAAAASTRVSKAKPPAAEVAETAATAVAPARRSARGAK